MFTINGDATVFLKAISTVGGDIGREADLLIRMDERELPGHPKIDLLRMFLSYDPGNPSVKGLVGLTNVGQAALEAVQAEGFIECGGGCVCTPSDVPKRIVRLAIAARHLRKAIEPVEGGLWSKGLFMETLKRMTGDHAMVPKVVAKAIAAIE